MNLRVFILLGTVLLMGSAEAKASQAMFVIRSETPVYEGPGETFQILEKLEQQDQVAASNLTTLDFHKVRTASGVVGWVKQELLSFNDPGPLGTKVKKSARSPDLPYFRIKALGGVSLFSVSDVNQRMSFEALSNGIHFGGIAELPLEFTIKNHTFWWALALRVERMQKTVAAVFSTTQVTYIFDVSSLPVYAGAKIAPLRSEHFRLDISTLFGLGAWTRLTSTGVGVTSPNTLQFTSNPMGLIATAELNYQPNKYFSVFIEAGYRWFYAQKQSPDFAANGQEIFYDTSNVLQPVSINLSGFVLGGGLGIQF